MLKTELLGLPVYDSPETDLFKIQDWNDANTSLEASHKALTMFRDELPRVNANAELIDARDGEALLGDKIRGISSSLADIPNYLTTDGRAYFISKLTNINGSSGKVTFVGDSITYNGWFDSITDYFPNIQKINKGIGGNTTLDIVNRINDIKSTNPSLFVLAIGVNDSRYNDSRGATNQNEYIANITNIVNTLKLVAPVVVIGIWRTYWTDQYASLGTYQNRLRVNSWNGALELYCKNNAIPFINPNIMLDKVVDFANIQSILKPISDTNSTPDGVHPNSNLGNKIYLEAVLNGGYNRDRYSLAFNFTSKYFYKLDIHATNDNASGFCILEWLHPLPLVTSGEFFVATSNFAYSDLTKLFASSTQGTGFIGVANKANEFPLTIVFGTNEKLTNLDYLFKKSSTERSIRSFSLMETQDPNVFVNPYSEKWNLIHQEGFERSKLDTLLYDNNKIKFLKVSGCSNIFNSTYSKLNFPNTDISLGLSWDNTNNRFISKTEGIYNIRTRLYLDSATLPVADGDRCLFNVYKNGSDYARVFDNTVGINSKMINFDYNIYLNTGDYIEVWANTSKSGGLQILSNNAFTDLIITKVQ